MQWVALKHQTIFSWHDYVPPEVLYSPLVIVLMHVLVIVLCIGLVCFLQPYGRRLNGFCLTALLLTAVEGVIVLSMAKAYDNVLTRDGVATMQSELDTDYYQQDLKLMGKLGFYGGLLKENDTPKGYYVCRQIDVFGPFAEQLVPDTPEQMYSEGYEGYYEQERNELLQVYGFSQYSYADEYWLVLKRFVSTEDLRIEFETVDDLRKYIVQAEFVYHSGSSETALLRDFNEIGGDMVKLH